MEGIIFDIKHFAVHDGPGIRQTIFFKGCPLRCWWCHNPESQKPEPETFTKVNKLDGKHFERKNTIGKKITVAELMKTIVGDRVFFSESGGGVTFSGGEPLIQHKFLNALLTECRQERIHTAIDTSGYASHEIFRQIAPFSDLFLFDIKLLNDALHKKYTNVPVKPILDNLFWLDQRRIKTILRFPVIPGITDDKENIAQISTLLKQLEYIKKIDLLPYHNISNSKYQRFQIENKMTDKKTPPGKSLDLLTERFAEIGFQVGIGG